MTLEQTKRWVVATLEEAKSQAITTLNVTELCAFTEMMMICSGSSKRHVKAIATRLTEQIKHHHQLRCLGVEGKDQGEWILVDMGEVVVHIMQPEVREFYNLEQLWHIHSFNDSEHSSA